MKKHLIPGLRLPFRSLSALLALLITASTTSLACTSVIVSGRVTPDGRPYIFKNRDTENTDNLVVQAQGRRYRFIAVVSARDTLNRNVWSGHNEAGFAIANTAAYNLNGRPQPGRPRPQGDEKDGSLMTQALELCATLADFEHLLDSLKARGPLASNSNFAVLDAQGGVAYYETGNTGYVKFDANDQLQAPYGYLIRTNHGMSGDRTMDKGVERYMAINDYMTQAAFAGRLDFETIIRKVTRHLTHGLTRINLYEQQPEDDREPLFVPFRDFIPRYQTASAHLVQGVRPGEDPLTTVSWIVPGSTLTTVAIPLWLQPKGDLPQVVTRGGDKRRSTLVDAGFQLKRQLFPIERGNGSDYLNLARLINRQGTGILQQLQPVEDEIFRRAQPVIETLRKNGRASRETTDFYQWLDDYLRQQYAQRFNLSL